MDVYLQEQYVTVTYLEELNSVVVDWKKKYLSHEQYSHGLVAGLEVVHHKGATRWLGDLKKVGALPSRSLLWMEQDFLPRANKSSLQHWAYVTSDYVLNNIDIGTVFSKVPHLKFPVRYFATYQEALDWLATCPDRIE